MPSTTVPSTYASSQVLPPSDIRSEFRRSQQPTGYKPPLSPTFSDIQYVKSGMIPSDYPPTTATAVSREPPAQHVSLSFYRSLSWMLGFKEKFSLLWFFVFGGALMGFCLARSMTLSPPRLQKETTAGEYFWFGRPFFKINYILHVYLTIVGGIFVGLQFIPGLRRRAVILHRINGYFCLFCLLPGNIVGSIVGAKAFGGEINAVTVYVLLGIMIVFSGLAGLYNVKKQTRQHRKWMLRMVTYFSVPVTARVITVIAKPIISRVGTYWAIWRCDEMMFVMQKSVTVAQELYPQCFAAGVDPAKLSIAAHASLHEYKVNAASLGRVVIPMALWLSTVMHVAGVEAYLRLTESTNHSRYGYVLEPIDYDGEGQPLWSYEK